MPKNNWSREETVIAFNVYCKIPFKESNKNHPVIIEHAEVIGRSPSALNMKVGNFGRLDPELRKRGIVGLVNGSKLEEDVWNEFYGNWEELAFESEKLISKFKSIKTGDRKSFELESFPEGVDKASTVKTRVNQSFFRNMILSSYNLKCCITGLPIPSLLVASHIKPWSVDKKNRVNPHNGLCLNSIHDKAFDKGYITITPEYKVLISNYFDDYLDSHSVNETFMKYQNHKVNLPDRFLPSREFLDYHFQEVFIR